MGIKKLFKRVKIKNDNPKIMEVIASWLAERGYEKQDFLEILKLAAIKTPVKLQTLAMYKDEFVCIDKNKHYYKIEFFREGNLVKIKISTNSDIRIFILNKKENNSDSMNLIYRERVLKKDNKVLQSENSISCSKKVLEVNGKKVVIIKCQKVGMDSEEAHRIDFKAWEAIEEYLISLNCDGKINVESIQAKLNERFLGQYICDIEVKPC
ncbi:hypothetical protein D3C72_795750 [compost metagenome]